MDNIIIADVMSEMVDEVVGEKSKEGDWSILCSTIYFLLNFPFGICDLCLVIIFYVLYTGMTFQFSGVFSMFSMSEFLII